MAFHTGQVGLAETKIDAALALREKVRPAPSQMTRMGATTKWFSPRHEKLVGERTRYRAFTKAYRGARRSAFNSSANEEFPVPQKMGHTRLSYSWEDLTDIKTTIKWNMLQGEKHNDIDYAVYELVTELYAQAELDLMELLNIGMFQTYTAALCQIAGIYDADGTTFTGASGHAEAYINIKNGPIGRIQVGDVLDIYDSTSAGGSDTKNRTINVTDVIHGENGPYDSNGDRVAGIGPGFLGEPCDAYGVAAATAWNSGGTTPDADDFIARSGEFQTSTTNPHTLHGFPDWFDPTVKCLRDGDGTLMDPTASGNRWQQPMIITPSGASEGSEVEFDPETHLAELADNWITQVRVGRKMRRAQVINIGNAGPGGKSGRIEISDHLVLVTEPKMVNHVVTEAKATEQFVHSSMLNEKAAVALKRIGVEGFDGYVWHSPSLGSVAMLGDPNCKPHHAFLIEPSSFFWIEPKDGQRITWVSHGKGSRVWPIAGDTNGTPTYSRQAAAHIMLGLQNDQPQANAMIEHIQTAREGA